ncbi:Diphthine synthase [Candidatus Tiddalikarchaeum anstoanum]|nr:Diphthine synthase [Candidatus Tiddalikarchaeum anstoanum]
MFYLIGLGIYGWKGLSVEGLNACKNADSMFIETYTNIIQKEYIIDLEKTINKKIRELSRDDVETKSEELFIDKSKKSDVCLLVGGDPLTATTHIELLRLCKEKGIKFKVVHAASIYNSVCETGLHVYKFGKSCSIPFPEPHYNPTSFFDIIEQNQKIEAHTIVFLDIKKDQDKYMTISEGLNILLNISKEKKSFFNDNTKVIGIARLGSPDQVIRYGSVKELLNFDFGKNPHILIVPKMGKIEEEYAKELYS